MAQATGVWPLAAITVLGEIDNTPAWGYMGRCGSSSCPRWGTFADLTCWETPMAKAEVSVTIDRPLEDVFAVLTDVEKSATWSAPTVEEHWTTPGPVGVGSRRHAVTRYLGRRAENDAEVSEFEPNRKWTMCSLSGPP